MEHNVYLLLSTESGQFPPLLVRRQLSNWTLDRSTQTLAVYIYSTDVSECGLTTVRLGAMHGGAAALLFGIYHID